MLKKRLITGSLLAAVAAVAFLWEGRPGGTLFLMCAAGMIYAALTEYEKICTRLGCPAFPYVLPIFGVLLVLSIGVPPLAEWQVLGGGRLLGAAEVLLLLCFLVTSAILALRAEDLRRGLARFAFSIMGMGLIYAPLSFIPKLYFAEGLGAGGRALAFFVIAVTKCGDIGAYALGSYTARRPQGNHKITPRLSPGKSWEGLGGACIAGVLTALLLVVFANGEIAVVGAPSVGYGSALLLGVFFAVAGLLGDLTESAFKRAAGLKDSGSLPGLGGILDLADSLIFTAPLFCAYIYLAGCW
jgi:CDP-diglyceride synthetase